MFASRPRRYSIPKDYVVLLVLPLANTDGAVYRDAGQFDPSRWASGGGHGHEHGRGADGTAADNTMPREVPKDSFTYGAGDRGCLGVHVLRPLLGEVMHMLLNTFDWSLDYDYSAGRPKYKWLPVARPSAPVHVVLTKRATRPPATATGAPGGAAATDPATAAASAAAAGGFRAHADL